MIITFLGHRSLYNKTEVLEKLKRALIDSIKQNEKTTFYCGGCGTFDNLCVSICHFIKKEYTSAEIVYVTPYLNESHQKKMKDMLNTGTYDSIIYPPLENTPPKYAIIKRNEWMVHQADLIIAYVEYSNGGAYRTLEYAKRKGKKISNLAES